jgi:hypothetical protein
MYPHVVQFESRLIEPERELQSIRARRQARASAKAARGALPGICGRRARARADRLEVVHTIKPTA